MLKGFDYKFCKTWKFQSDVHIQSEAKADILIWSTTSYYADYKQWLHSLNMMRYILVVLRDDVRTESCGIVFVWHRIREVRGPGEARPLIWSKPLLDACKSREQSAVVSFALHIASSDS